MVPSFSGCLRPAIFGFSQGWGKAGGAPRRPSGARLRMGPFKAPVPPGSRLCLALVMPSRLLSASQGVTEPPRPAPALTLKNPFFASAALTAEALRGLAEGRPKAGLHEEQPRPKSSRGRSLGGWRGRKRPGWGQEVASGGDAHSWMLLRGASAPTRRMPGILGPQSRPFLTSQIWRTSVSPSGRDRPPPHATRASQDKGLKGRRLEVGSGCTKAVSSLGRLPAAGSFSSVQSHQAPGGPPLVNSLLAPITPPTSRLTSVPLARAGVPSPGREGAGAQVAQAVDWGPGPPQLLSLPFPPPRSGALHTSHLPCVRRCPILSVFISSLDS